MKEMKEMKVDFRLDNETVPAWEWPSLVMAWGEGSIPRDGETVDIEEFFDEVPSDYKKNTWWVHSVSHRKSDGRRFTEIQLKNYPVK